MSTIAKLLRWPGIALLVILGAGWLPAINGAYGLFWERYASAFLTNPLDRAYRWHQPLETVHGGDAPPLGLDGEAAKAFRPGVLEEVTLQARLLNSDALLVMHAGKLVLQQYWNTRKAHSLANAHELSHVLSAILIGHAIADGSIGSVDQPVYRFIPEWDKEPYRNIRIRDLLHMESGLEETHGPWPWSPRVARLMGTDIEAANLAVGVAGPPGERYARIAPAAQVLAILIERATGRRYADYLSEKLWRPIGARDAQMMLDQPGGMVHADCCMWVVSEDWTRVGEALRTGGLWQGRQVIPAGWVDAMMRPSAADPRHGMMVWLADGYEPERHYDPADDAFVTRQSEPFAAPTFFLDGRLGQRVWVVPSKALVIVRTGKDHPDWDDAKLPNLLIRGLVD